MRKFTVISMALIILVFAGLAAYIGLGEDFTPPAGYVDIDGFEVDRSGPVWDRTLDELAAYLAEKGVVDPNDMIKVNMGMDTRGLEGYRYSGKIDIYRYDLDEADEYTLNNYKSYATVGSIVYVNGQVGYSWINGPFELHFYEWVDDPVPEEEQQPIIDIFMAFGQEETGGEDAK